MSIYKITNLEEELDEISQSVIEALSDIKAKEIYVINSMLGETGKKIIEKNNIKFYFQQFLPGQTNYLNISKETDGYICKDIHYQILNSIPPTHSFYRTSTQRIYYKVKK